MPPETALGKAGNAWRALESAYAYVNFESPLVMFGKSHRQG
jgi:hypothetical protein